MRATKLSGWLGLAVFILALSQFNLQAAFELGPTSGSNINSFGSEVFPSFSQLNILSFQQPTGGNVLFQQVIQPNLAPGFINFPQSSTPPAISISGIIPSASDVPVNFPTVVEAFSPPAFSPAFQPVIPAETTVFNSPGLFFQVTQNQQPSPVRPASGTFNVGVFTPFGPDPSTDPGVIFNGTFTTFGPAAGFGARSLQTVSTFSAAPDFQAPSGSPVPEPMTLLLFGAGLGAAALLRRNTRKA